MQTSTTSSTTRRRLLGWWTALAGTVGALAAPALAGLADPHVAWKRELDAVVQRINAGELPADAEDALYAEQFRLLGLIGETSAVTLAGIAAQARVALDSAEGGMGISGLDLQALRNAIASLERLSAA